MKISEEFGAYFARIPLKATPHIVCGNALQIDWAAVLPPENWRFILDNPPFLGKSNQSAEQKANLQLVCGDIKNAGLLDFVSAWYVKAARYINQNAVIADLNRNLVNKAVMLKQVQHDSGIKCAFVSTNSITQGEQVGVLWVWMLAQGIKIHFAQRTFSWNNEARGNAAVHCVIIGFGLQDVQDKTIYKYEAIKGEPHAVKATNINPYLVDALNLVLPDRGLPISNVPEIQYGSMSNDGGNLILSPEERKIFIDNEPDIEGLIRRYIGADDLINNKLCYCLWLKDISPQVIKASRQIMERITKVAKHRLASANLAANVAANTPTPFFSERQPTTDYLAIPRTSSEKRGFIPIDFLDKSVIANTDVFVVPYATAFNFGVLTSTMHMAWVRTVCGRLKSDFRYSAGIVYNNFPWPDVAEKSPVIAGLTRNLVNQAEILKQVQDDNRQVQDDNRQVQDDNRQVQDDNRQVQDDNKQVLRHEEQSARNMLENIEAAAQVVLDVRASHPNASLADLYDPLTMPASLLKAHQVLDKAVDAA